MALPRPVLFVLLGLALIASALLATRGAADPDGAVTAPPAPAPKVQAATPAPAKPATPAKPAKQAAAPEAKAAKPATKPSPAPAKPKAQENGIPAKLTPVVRALARGDAVVLFLTKDGAADDAATRKAVASVKGMRNVSVVQAGLADLVDYRSVLSGAGVSQIPAVVIVRTGHKATLIEGYVDGKTLRQNIADALR
jgi:outer membrane biosynthesis protein TonB